MRHLITAILVLSLWAPGTALAGLGNYRDIEACEDKVAGTRCEGTQGIGVCTHVEQCSHLLKKGKNGQRVGEWRSCVRCVSSCHKKAIGDVCTRFGLPGVCTVSGTVEMWSPHRWQDKITCERPPLRYYLRRPKYYLPAGGVLIVIAVAAIALVRRRRT